MCRHPPGLYVLVCLCICLHKVHHGPRHFFSFSFSHLPTPLSPSRQSVPERLLHCTRLALQPWSTHLYPPVTRVRPPCRSRFRDSTLTQTVLPPFLSTVVSVGQYPVLQSLHLSMQRSLTTLRHYVHFHKSLVRDLGTWFSLYFYHRRSPSFLLC